jgi:hypothetical protein
MHVRKLLCYISSFGSGLVCQVGRIDGIQQIAMDAVMDLKSFYQVFHLKNHCNLKWAI